MDVSISKLTTTTTIQIRILVQIRKTSKDTEVRLNSEIKIPRDSTSAFKFILSEIICTDYIKLMSNLFLL